MKVATVFSLLVLACTAAAADEGALLECAAIDDDARRLVCYDFLANRERRANSPERTVAARSATPVRAGDEPARTIQTETLPPPKKPAPVRTEATGDEREFGLEQIETDAATAISSRYDGEFTGWTGRTLFKLENGQVWRQAEAGRYRTSMDRPMIVIQRGAFSSYRLKVEGLNRSIRVKRVR